MCGFYYFVSNTATNERQHLLVSRNTLRIFHKRRTASWENPIWKMVRLMRCIPLHRHCRISEWPSHIRKLRKKTEIHNDFHSAQEYAMLTFNFELYIEENLWGTIQNRMRCMKLYRNCRIHQWPSDVAQSSTKKNNVPQMSNCILRNTFIWEW